MIFHQPFNSLSNYNFNTAFYTKSVWDYHLHKNLELVWVLEGALSCTVNSTEKLLQAGEMALCLPYDVHRYVPQAGTRYWVLVFSEDYVRFFAKQIAGKQAESIGFRPSTALAEYATRRLVGNKTPSILTLKSCLYGICEEYLQSTKLIDKPFRETDVFAVITAYVRAHHTEGITLADVAREAGYDYNYMSRYFKKRFHMSFSEFINVYRLETALGLLEDMGKSITDIAFESGFQSVRTFNAFFRRQMGQSPSAYRKMQTAELITDAAAMSQDEHPISP